jgi:hypothetical protein
MNITELPAESPIIQGISHIQNWQMAIRDEVTDILIKLSNGWALSEKDLAFLANPAEVAAIWSVTSKHQVKPSYPRELRRSGRIKEADKDGSGRATRMWYRVGDIIDIRITSQRGPKPGGKKTSSMDEAA